MKTGKLARIVSLIPLIGLLVMAIGGVAHARELCVPFLGCFNLPTPPSHHDGIGAPELDIGMAVSGVTVLVASILVVVERRRRR